MSKNGNVNDNEQNEDHHPNQGVMSDIHAQYKDKEAQKDKDHIFGNKIHEDKSAAL